MALIEGFGDEVLWALGLIVLVLLIGLAWWSTQVRPLFATNSVWLVQMQTWPHNRVLQMVNIDEAAAEQISSDPNTRTVRIDTNADDVVEATLQVLPELEVSIENMPPSTSTDTSVNETVTVGGQDQTESVSAPIEETVTPDASICLKFLDDTQRLVATWLDRTVGEFKRQHFSAEVDEGKVIRLIYKGQLLRDDDRSLASYGLHDQCIVHAHVSATPYQHSTHTNHPHLRYRPTTATPASSTGTLETGPLFAGVQQGPVPPNAERNASAPAQQAGLELGRYIFWIFGVKFVAIWGFCIAYPQYFDFASLCSLLLCTFVYLSFLVVNLRRVRTERLHAQGIHID